MTKPKRLIGIIIVIVIASLFCVAISFFILDEEKTDLKKVQRIYPTKAGGDEWFMNPQNLDKDNRFDPNANLTKNAPIGNNGDGIWSVDSALKTRLDVWTKGSEGFRQKDEMDTYNHSVIESRGFWYKPNDWKNVEMTGYFKLNEYVDDEYSSYSRSIWHNSTENGCGGSDYKRRLHFDGTVSLSKEEWHVNYTFQPTKPDESQYKSIGLGNLINKWVGVKSIVYNILENGRTYPKMEIWVDKNNDDRWIKIHEYVDRGGWGSTMERCGGQPDQVITWGSPVATFRWDNTAKVEFKDLSVREIQAPQL